MTDELFQKELHKWRLKTINALKIPRFISGKEPRRNAITRLWGRLQARVFVWRFVNPLVHKVIEFEKGAVCQDK